MEYGENGVWGGEDVETVDYYFTKCDQEKEERLCIIQKGIQDQGRELFGGGGDLSMMTG